MTNSSSQGIPYSVSVQGDHYVVQIDRRLVTREELNSLLDAILFQSIVQKSHATQTEIAALAEEIDRNAWGRVSHSFA